MEDLFLDVIEADINGDIDKRTKLSRKLFGWCMGHSPIPGVYVRNNEDFTIEDDVLQGADLIPIISFLCLCGQYGEIDKIKTLNNLTFFQHLYVAFILGTPIAKVLSPVLLLLTYFSKRSINRYIMLYTLAKINRIIFLGGLYDKRRV